MSDEKQHTGSMISGFSWLWAWGGLWVAVGLLLALPISAQTGPIARPSVYLNLRAAPTTESGVVAVLNVEDTLIVVGRTRDMSWLQVQTDDNQVGWVSAAYVLGGDMSAVPITYANDADSGLQLSDRVAENIRRIAQIGASFGNRPNVFAKVGDSITVARHVFRPIGEGVYWLGNYQYLQDVIDYYSAADVFGLNSFERVSAAAGVGWTSDAALSPDMTEDDQCLPGEMPLVCEYRLIRPSVALIMFGTNDLSYFDAVTFQYKMLEIVRISENMGVIPVISTIPYRVDYGPKTDVFNQIIRDIAYAQALPLWDYGAAMAELPYSGLAGDGVHPAIPPFGYVGSADFRDPNLDYGYVVRNLTGLQILDAVWRALESDES